MPTLYHYCSTEAFHSIITNHSIRLSSLTLSNDSMEGKLVPSVLKRLAERAGHEPIIVTRICEAYTHFSEQYDGLGFCLSNKEDSLSQWRGYASDGTGVSIGFSDEFLKSGDPQPGDPWTQYFRLEEVKYTPEGHDYLIEPTYNEVNKFIKLGAFQEFNLMLYLETNNEEERQSRLNERNRNNNASMIALIGLLAKQFSLKNLAFNEEEEWRLVSLMYRNEPGSCHFKSGIGKIVPYRNFDLLKRASHPIERVILGPKHQSPPWMVKAFLKECGFGDIVVDLSSATYR